MDLLMPAGSLDEFESTLTTNSLSAALQEIEAAKYTVSLPKFSFKNQINLIPVLEDLGMQDAFKKGVADLSGIDGKQDLFVNLVIQQAMVEVDETGTVAAAATATGGASDGAVSINPAVVIDHPFLFLIRDTNTGSVLFMGRVEDPSQTS
jgi:serpin B